MHGKETRICVGKKASKEEVEEVTLSPLPVKKPHFTALWLHSILRPNTKGDAGGPDVCFHGQVRVAPPFKAPPYFGVVLAFDRMFQNVQALTF